MDKHITFLNECKEQPYGFLGWITKVWLVMVDKKIFNRHNRDDLYTLDVKAWSVYFMAGLSPFNAVLADIKEGGENG